MKKFSICKSGKFGKGYNEIATVKATSPVKAAKKFTDGRAVVKPTKGVYHVLYKGAYKQKIKV